MTEDEILSEFRSADALLEGHFLLSSGRHSAHYLQCARLLMNPDRASRIAVAIAQKLPELPAGARVLGFNYDTGERYLSIEGFLPS